MGLVARRLAQRASMSATGDRLTRLMKERGVSMASLATAIRIQRSTLENFRDGHRDLPAEVVAAMANELGTSADFLMDRSEDPRPVAAIQEESRLRNEALFAELEDGDSNEADELPSRGSSSASLESPSSSSARGPRCGVGLLLYRGDRSWVLRSIHQEVCARSQLVRHGGDHLGGQVTMAVPEVLERAPLNTDRCGQGGHRDAPLLHETREPVPRRRHRRPLGEPSCDESHAVSPTPGPHRSDAPEAVPAPLPIHAASGVACAGLTIATPCPAGGASGADAFSTRHRRQRLHSARCLRHAQVYEEPDRPPADRATRHARTPR